ncbi:MAG: serine/threonine protein kinase [Myxococcales bacterium]|nr:serine/threonine protein kinase [Myxococcales bacterium]
MRAGQRLGKYKVRRRLARGGFGDVYEAYDTIEGIPIALKIPLGISERTIDDFRREIQITARLDHPNILAIKNADFIDEILVVAYPLGERSLTDRLTRRMSLANVLDYASQLLDGLAHAHEHKIVHCDVKPDNLIMFRNGRVCLGDFGIAKFGMRTIRGSNSGTLGYIAPEQAMGQPSMRSDVFSAGLVIYRMLTGQVPDWPFKWPPPGHERLRRRAPDLDDFLRRALAVDARKRFRDAGVMLRAFERIRPRALKRATKRRSTTRR